MQRLSLVQKTDCRRTLDRVWGAYLTAHERVVLGFIYTTTTEWGKLGDRLKVEHFVYGLGAISGTGLSEKSVRRALDSLEQDGGISRKRTPRGHVISINWDWQPDDIRVPKHMKLEAGVGLKLPKKPRSDRSNRPLVIGQVDHSIREGDTFQGHTFHSRSAIASEWGQDGAEEQKATPKKAPEAVASVEDRIQQAAAGTLERAQVKRLADIEKAARRYNPDLVRSIWAKAFHETFPEATLPSWTKREKGQAKLFVEATVAHNAGWQPHEIIEWCVREWRLLVSVKFSWMKDGAPELPVIGFMLRFKDLFYEAWNERARLRQDMVVSGRDRHIRRLIHRGLTHEQAQKETEEKDKIAAERAEMAKERERMNEMMRRSEQRNNQLDTQKLLRRPKAATGGPVRPAVKDDFSTEGFGALPEMDDEG